MIPLQFQVQQFQAIQLWCDGKNWLTLQLCTILKSGDLRFILCTSQYQWHHIYINNIVLAQGFSHIFGLEPQREWCLNHGDFTMKAKKWPDSDFCAYINSLHETSDHLLHLPISNINIFSLCYLLHPPSPLLPFPALALNPSLHITLSTYF